MPAYDKLAFFFEFCQHFLRGTIFVFKAITSNKLIN